jgi:hypothetical protein
MESKQNQNSIRSVALQVVPARVNQVALHVYNLTVSPCYEFLTVSRTLCVAVFSRNLFIYFQIPGSNVSLGKVFGNEWKIHCDLKRSAPHR